MDYRIETTKRQKFIAMVRAFSNEIINDEENHEIPDFWSECKEKKLIKQLWDLRPQGKKDFYGLCSPSKEGEETFNYGIGILLDEDTSKLDEESMRNAGYKIWDVEPGTYVVFKCIGEDGECIGDMWSRFYKEFLPQMGYKAADATDYELYFDKGEPGVFCELWIPIKKK